MGNTEAVGRTEKTKTGIFFFYVGKNLTQRKSKKFRAESGYLSPPPH